MVGLLLVSLQAQSKKGSRLRTPHIHKDSGNPYKNSRTDMDDIDKYIHSGSIQDYSHDSRTNSQRILSAEQIYIYIRTLYIYINLLMLF